MRTRPVLSIASLSFLLLGLTVSGPDTVISHQEIGDYIGSLPDGPLSSFKVDNTIHWLVPGNGSDPVGTGAYRHSSSSGSCNPCSGSSSILNAPFSSTSTSGNWQRRPHDQIFTNPHALDVVKPDGSYYPGRGWIMNLYRNSGNGGILAFVHVEAWAQNDTTYYRDGNGNYCYLAQPTRLPHIPRYAGSPAGTPPPGATACQGLPSTIAGEFIVGSRRYYSDETYYCKYPVVGLSHGVPIYTGFPTQESSVGNCGAQSGAPPTSPSGFYNVNDTNTYYGYNGEFCRLTRPTVVGSVPNYASAPSASNCSAPSTITPSGNFIVGSQRYYSNGSSAYCRYVVDGSTSGLQIYSDLPTSYGHAGDCSGAPNYSGLPGSAGFFNFQNAAATFAYRIGLAWSTDGGNTFRYLGHIVTPYNDGGLQEVTNMHGVPYLVKDGYLYIYYVEGGHGGDTDLFRRAAVARAPLSTVLSDADAGTVGSWSKRYSGGWSSTAAIAGGPADDLGLSGLAVDSSTPEPNGSLHSDAACHSTSSGSTCYLIVIPYAGYIKIFSSTDAVSWSSFTQIGSNVRYQYASIINEDGSDNGLVGNRFFVYAFRDFRNEESAQAGHRWLIDVN